MSSTQPRPSPRSGLGLGTGWRVLMIALGVVCVGVGGIAVFVSLNTAGTAALIAVGAVLIVAGTFANTIKSLEAAGVKMELERARAEGLSTAATSLEAAARAEDEGRHADATKLRGDASKLLDAIEATAAEYEAIRRDRPSSRSRTAQMEQLVDQLKVVAPQAQGPGEVAELFSQGDDGSRIVALALMSADPGLGAIEPVLDALTRPRSRFEHYSALRAAQTMIAGSVSDADRTAIAAVLRTGMAEGRFGGENSDRWRLASAVQETLAQP